MNQVHLSVYRYYYFVVFALICLAFSQPVHAVELRGSSAVLMDASSGRLLYSKQAHDRHYPASITKILTALVTLEHVSPDTIVTVSGQAAQQEGSSMHLQAGSRLTVRDLLYGLLLSSGNDAAVALAEITAGGIKPFAKLMNETAKRIGARESNFINPSGLPHPDQYTTAVDMARITRYTLLTQPLFREIIATRRYTIVYQDGRRQKLFNHNYALGSYGFDGVKNGYTIAARHTYVGSQTRNEWQLIAVSLRTSKQGKYTDALKLFNYGFSQYTPVPLHQSSEYIGSLPVRNGVQPRIPVRVGLSDKQYWVPLRRNGSEAAAYHVKFYHDQIAAPINQGQLLGELGVLVDGQLLAHYPLYAAFDIEKMPEPPRPIWLILWQETVRIMHKLFFK